MVSLIDYLLATKGAFRSHLRRLFLCRRLLPDTRFLLFCFTLGASSAAIADSPATNPALDTSCHVDSYDQSATVQYVHDGDTLKLSDGRKVRLIGINTPELARDNRPAEAFAVEATKALKTMIRPGAAVHLRFGRDRKDHYDRLLAHVFSGDGKNLQAELLKNGYARAIVIPPNTAFSACYLAQERLARCNKAGIWHKNRTLQAKDIKNGDTGFQLISGTLQNMHINDKGIWLNIDNKLTIGIRPDNIQLFDVEKITAMLNEQVSVRGWLNVNRHRKKDKNTAFYMRIRHPAALQLSSEYRCKIGQQSRPSLSD
ncbi:MAG: thermonuclease family protein [Proteobacteria bacterium]|nr:thermonuclease family protein [Pseudomonadota bacterium]